MTITLRTRGYSIGIDKELCEALNIPDTTHLSFKRIPETGEYYITEGSFLNDGDYKLNQQISVNKGIKYRSYSVNCEVLHTRLSEFYGRPYKQRLTIPVEPDEIDGESVYVLNIS